MRLELGGLDFEALRGPAWAFPVRITEISTRKNLQRDCFLATHPGSFQAGAKTGAWSWQIDGFSVRRELTFSSMAHAGAFRDYGLLA